MDNSKTPLPDNQDRIDGDDNQQVDINNPMLHIIDNDDVIDNNAGFSNSEVGSAATEGLTPTHRQNIDEANVDNVLVQDNLYDSDYPNIVDIADRDASEHSNKNNF